ncbi:conserved Plasmodium protein, unknown function [Plasmodium gallinaceum]|uniref:Uncharacterized protein n=1 Tax=Plasmodium gallinaceum TaxID=5849 RepID=A0A1J1GZB0_PLAGA|nr:conserved Plasmodium protein, unknown function [Plasmodium gallinaceum]CRG97639.1 conserved Plasmodium protein, unknown function [Plasmodium gallinaceum]
MDLCTLEKNNKSIESLCKVLEKNYKTFYLLNPDGILDSVAGLENLSISFCNISFKTIICYKCLTFFDCESNANFRKCPKCKVVNAIVPYDNIGKKVIILICFHCNNRNITNIECSYVQCYLCNYMNYAQYYNSNNNNRAEINNNRVTGRRRKIINFFMFRNMCKCVNPHSSTRNNSRENNITNEEQNDNRIMGRVSENNREMNNININNVLDVDREVYNNQRMNNVIFHNEEIHGIVKESVTYNDENNAHFNKFNVNNANSNTLLTNERFNENMGNFNNNIKNNKKNKEVRSNKKHLEKINNIECNENLFLDKNNDVDIVSNDNKTYKSSFNLSTQAGSCPRNSDMWYDEHLNLLDNYREKLGTVVENGNVKRKTLMFSNMHDIYNKKIIKKLSFTGTNGKRDSDVKRYIEYFNKLHCKRDSDLTDMVEDGDYHRLFNIHKENIENENFYKYLEYYEKFNIKNISDNFSKKNMVDNFINGNLNNNKNMNSEKCVENLNNFKLNNYNNMDIRNLNNFSLNNKDTKSYVNKYSSKVNNNKNREIKLYSVNQKKAENISQKVKNKNVDSQKMSACIEDESNKKSKYTNGNNGLKSKNKVNKSPHKKKKNKYENKNEDKYIFYSKSELCSEFR